MFGGNEGVERIASPVPIGFRNSRPRDGIKWPPAVGREESIKLRPALFGICHLFFGGSVLAISRIMAEQNFGLVVHAIAVAVFVSDQFQPRGQVLLLPLGNQLFANDAQSCAKGIMRELIQALRVFIFTRQVASRATSQSFGQELVVMLFERRFVSGSGPRLEHRPEQHASDHGANPDKPEAWNVVGHAT